jgi:hypothetical protein
MKLILFIAALSLQYYTSAQIIGADAPKIEGGKIKSKTIYTVLYNKWYTTLYSRLDTTKYISGRDSFNINGNNTYQETYRDSVLEYIIKSTYNSVENSQTRITNDKDSAIDYNKCKYNNQGKILEYYVNNKYSGESSWCYGYDSLNRIKYITYNNEVQDSFYYKPNKDIISYHAFGHPYTTYTYKTPFDSISTILSLGSYSNSSSRTDTFGYVHYDYDSLNRIAFYINKSSQPYSRRTIYTSQFIYDKDGGYKQINTLDGAVFESIFSNKGLLIEHVNWQGTEIERREKYFYDEKNLLLKIDIYNFSSELIEQQFYEYTFW